MGLKDKLPSLLGKQRQPNYQSLDSNKNPKSKMVADAHALQPEVTKATQKEPATCGSVLRDNLLIFLTLVGVALGFGIGFGIRPLNPSEDAMLWIGLPGEVYMRMLTCTILPLVVSSIIAGTATLDPKSNGKISTVALLFITLANGFGVLLGVAMYFIVRPGEGVEIMSRPTETPNTNLQTQDLFVDLIRNLFPDNIITTCFQTSTTVYVPHKVVQAMNASNMTTEELVRSKGTSSSMNILGIIVISSVVGMATSQVGEMARPFVHFFRATSEIIIKVLRWIVWFTPIGVLSLIAASVAAVEDLEATFASVGMFVLADCICMGLLILVIFPLVYFIIERKNPMKFLLIIIRPFMTSLATASTAVAIPDMFNVCENNLDIDVPISRFIIPFSDALNRSGNCCFILIATRPFNVCEMTATPRAVAIPDMFNVCENKLDIDVRISRFIIPFSDALNRSGSCCFILIATLFVCNLEQTDLEPPQYFVIAILTWVSGFAIPSVPSASIISILIILSSVNVQSTQIGLLLALEWLLDRLRTSANAICIILGAVLTNRLCSKDLIKLVDVETTSIATDVEVKVSQNDVAADTNM